MGFLFGQQKMQLDELKKKLVNDLDNEFVSTKAVLNGFLFGASEAFKVPAFSDPRYVPFYYHLSKYINPKRVVEVGFTLGALSGAFLRGSTSVEHFMGLYDGDLSRLAKRNVQLVCKCDYLLTKDVNNLKSNKWDLVIFDKELPYDDCRKMLDICWERLNLDGLLIYERCASENKAFVDFCKVHDRELMILKTRYGSGIVVR